MEDEMTLDFFHPQLPLRIPCYDFSLLATPRFVIAQWTTPHPRAARMERRAVCARIPRGCENRNPRRDVFSAP